MLPDHTENNVVISGIHINTNIKEGTSGDLENVCKLKIFQNPSFSSSDRDFFIGEYIPQFGSSAVENDSEFSF